MIKLFNDNMKLSYYVANKYKNCGIDYDDLVQISMMGLWKACKTYNPELTKFSTYATMVITNEILLTLRKRKHKDLVYPISLDYIYDDLGVAMVDLIPDESDTQISLETRDTYVKIRELMNDLSDFERSCLDLYYLNDCTQKDIATYMNVSQAQVSRTINKALRKLRVRYMMKYGGKDENTS